MSSTEESDSVTAEDRDYFRSLEESFLALRGRTTLLGPEDFRVAQVWRHAGIPAELVQRVMTDLFTRQRMRKSKRGISSLRYFRAAVEAAWQERLELGAGGATAPASDPGPPLHLRLRRLAAAVPDAVPGALAIRREVLALDGDFEQVEKELTRLDALVLGACEKTLGESEIAEIAGKVEQALARIGAAMPEAERAEIRRRLRVQALRTRCGLSLLSLFAPRALDEEAESESEG